jgi:recombinational DNA repair protein (RecF pathway)
MLALKYLRHFQRSNFVEARRAHLTPPLNREMENLIQHYLTYVLERGLNTPPFLRQARRSVERSSEGLENEIDSE